MEKFSGFVAVGEAAEIMAVEKSMRRAWRRDRSNIWPSHCDAPVLRDGRMYGICVQPGQYHDTYLICNADTIVRSMIEEA